MAENTSTGTNLSTQVTRLPSSTEVAGGFRPFSASEFFSNDGLAPRFDKETNDLVEALRASVKADSFGDFTAELEEGLGAVIEVYNNTDAAFGYANLSVTSISMIRRLQKLYANLLRAKGDPHKLLQELLDLKRLLEKEKLTWKQRLSVRVASWKVVQRFPIVTFGFAKTQREAKPLLDDQLFHVVLEHVICAQITRLQEFFPRYIQAKKEVGEVIAAIAPGKRGRFLKARQAWILLVNAVNRQRAYCHELQAKFAEQRSEIAVEGGKGKKLITDVDIRNAYQQLLALEEQCSKAHTHYELVCDDVLTNAEASDAAVAHLDSIEDLPAEVGECVHQGFRFFIGLTLHAVLYRRQQHKAALREAQVRREQSRAERMKQNADAFGNAAGKEFEANEPDEKRRNKLLSGLRRFLPL